MERKYFEYQEKKNSKKLARAIFPKFHCVALFIVYTFHPTTFFQTGVFVGWYDIHGHLVIDWGPKHFIVCAHITSKLQH